MSTELLGSLQLHLQNVSLWTYALAYLGGILVSFTPCVYPVAPITIAYIGARSQGGKMRGFLLSLSYVAGMAVTYTALGGIAALSGSLFGQIQSSPWTYFVVANIFILMGLALLDVLALPAYTPRFVARLQPAGRPGGAGGSFIVGVTSGLIMGPCTTPILAVLLSYVAGRQNTFFGMSLLFIFSLGMGTLLILLGTFAGMLANLPRSGAWMVRISHLAGWILLAMGEYLLIKAGMLWI
ncbi:MAG: cytochrome c biogenesis protein CcdA [Smithellaceae bacterium]|nr:cytochrome c biogenesis protein CcdA [Smithellaceae bacterium]